MLWCIAGVPSSPAKRIYFTSQENLFHQPREFIFRSDIDGLSEMDYIPITPLTEGAVMRRRAGGAGCGARACVSHTQVREASGNRPSQLRGTAFVGWTREGRTRRKPAG